MLYGMPVPRVSSPRACPSKKSVITWDIAVRPPHASTPKSIWEVCARWPPLISENSYDTQRTHRALYHLQTLPRAHLSLRSPGFTGFLSSDRGPQCRGGAAQAGACLSRWYRSHDLVLAYQVPSAPGVLPVCARTWLCGEVAPPQRPAYVSPPPISLYLHHRGT